MSNEEPEELLPMVGSLGPLAHEHNHGVQEYPAPPGVCPRCDLLNAHVSGW